MSAMAVGDFFCMPSGRMPEEPGPPVKFTHKPLEGFRVDAREIPVRHHNQADPLRHMAPVATKVFSEPSLQAIPIHRPAQAARNSDT